MSNYTPSCSSRQKEQGGLESFGRYCFDERKMRDLLPRDVFKHLKQVQQGRERLTLEAANVIANALKNWAMEAGATHFSHWFQPLTGLTAEKHEAFLVPQSDGSALTFFSGQELTVSEPDASSFPSGGLRSTFEARGYTAWDTSSPAFIKRNGAQLILMIPTAFVSYTGEALDKKTPLLRSEEALNREALRVLRALGDTRSQMVFPTVGAEQEYFLVDQALYRRRSDLMLAGRTVIGSMAAKGQELEDHYYGAIKDRVADFMNELNLELWRLGINARTQHNEVAPSQFELALVYSVANRACDENQLVMETLKRVAHRQQLACLLHEKPFAGVNGSGKHNNWSLATDTGINLFDPGKSEQEHRQFLLMVAALMKGVDTHAGWLRATTASAGNDHRLGANEAPPAIISIYLAEEIQETFERLCKGEFWRKDVGDPRHYSRSLASFAGHNTDRNRTSPLAFTGNKFEFRMAGSSQAVADSTTVLNLALTDALATFADRLEQSRDVTATIHELIVENYQKHQRIVFNGNGYSEEWRQEAARRGLPNFGNTVDACSAMILPSTIEVCERFGVLTQPELHSRYHIALETYSKQVNIEVGVMMEMVERHIYPACCRFFDQQLCSLQGKKSLGLPHSEQMNRLQLQSQLHEQLLKLTSELAQRRDQANAHEGDALATARAFLQEVLPITSQLRQVIDRLQGYCSADLWPFPTYEELLFSL